VDTRKNIKNKIKNEKIEILEVDVDHLNIIRITPLSHGVLLSQASHKNYRTQLTRNNAILKYTLLRGHKMYVKCFERDETLPSIYLYQFLFLNNILINLFIVQKNIKGSNVSNCSGCTVSDTVCRNNRQQL